MSLLHDFSPPPPFEAAIAGQLDTKRTEILLAAALSEYAPLEDGASPTQKFEAAIESGHFPESLDLQVTDPRGVSLTVAAAPAPPPILVHTPKASRSSESTLNVMEYLLSNPGRGFRKIELASLTTGPTPDARLHTIPRVLTVLNVFPPANHLLYYAEDGVNRFGQYFALVASSKVGEIGLAAQLADTSWGKEAACRESNPKIFEQKEAGIGNVGRKRDMSEARSICGRCVVANACLIDSLASEEIEFHMVRSAFGDEERKVVVELSRAKGPAIAAQYALRLRANQALHSS